MRVQTVKLEDFKRFDDLTIDLGPIPKKIVAMVGPNGCGKSSVFDGFEQQLRPWRSSGPEKTEFYSKSLFREDNDANLENEQFSAQKAVTVIFESGGLHEKSFYFRTSYRYTPKLDIGGIKSLNETLNREDHPISSIAMDQRLHNNYERLHSILYSEYTKGVKTGNQIHGKFIKKINNILSNILDVRISDLGNPMEERGQFYFRKGSIVDFPYANLSSGEKEVIDLIIDLVLKSEEYTETVYCIDEPDLHLNTAIERKLLVEI